MRLSVACHVGQVVILHLSVGWALLMLRMLDAHCAESVVSGSARSIALSVSSRGSENSESSMYIRLNPRSSAVSPLGNKMFRPSMRSRGGMARGVVAAAPRREEPQVPPGSSFICNATLLVNISYGFGQPIVDCQGEDLDDSRYANRRPCVSTPDVKIAVDTPLTPSTPRH